MTLTEFLLARIAEDEANAERWHLYVGHGDFDMQPDRVLRECEAKRRIIERHSQTVECGNVGCQRRGLSGLHCLICDDEWPCPDLQDLAPIYADHPDFDGAWRA